MFHYMPWFDTPVTHPHGKWGLHWTMELNNPGKIKKIQKDIFSVKFEFLNFSR